MNTRAGSAVVTLPTDTQILITRVFDAPAALVWKAYTTPELVRQWWCGPEDEWVVCDVDLQVGGRWRWVFQHANDDGAFEVAFHGTYTEIDAPTRLVYTEVFEGAAGAGPDTDDGTLNTLTFAEADGVTTLTMHTECHSQFVRDVIIESGMEGGMQLSMDRLEAVAQRL